MRFSSSYFEVPKLLPTSNSKYYKTKMLNLTSKQLKSKEFKRGLPHLYKRFLRLHSFINVSTTTISSSRFVGLYASIIRTKFQVVYTYPFVTNIELVGDTDMFMKLRNIKQKYESIPKEQDKQKFLDKNLNTLILNNYLHYSIEDFVSFYNMLLNDINKNEGKFLNWILTKNVSVIENSSDLTTVRNNLLYGSIFKFDSMFYTKQVGDALAWRNLFKTSYSFVAGMKNYYNPTIIPYRKDLNDHVHITSDYQAKTKETILDERNAFLTHKFNSTDAMNEKNQQRSLMSTLLALRNFPKRTKQLLQTMSKKNDYNFLFMMLHNEIHLHNNPSIQKNYLSYLQFDATSENKIVDNTIEPAGFNWNTKRRISAKMLKRMEEKKRKIEYKVNNKTNENIKEMVAFLEENSKNLDTMKYGAIRYSHNILTSEYMKKKFILPYIKDEFN